MKIVLAGQKRFGRDVLNLLLERGDQILAVSAPQDQTDKLWIAAQNHRLPFISCKALCAATMPAGADLIIAAHCHSYLSAATRRKAQLGALGYHPSLLPRHRGRSSIEWTLRFGEKVTGGTLYWLNDTVDGGPIAAQEHILVPPGASAKELWADHLAPLGLRLFRQTLELLDRKIIIAEPQDPDLVTWEPAIQGVPPLWRPDLPALGHSDYQVMPSRSMMAAGK